MTRRYALPAPTVTGYAQDARIAAVKPPTVNITNGVANPSTETNTTGYTAIGGTIARVASKQRRGAWSLQVTPGVGVSDGVFYGTVATVAARAFPWSFDFWGEAGRKYLAYWASTAAARVSAAVEITATGYWQRIQVPYVETSSTTRRLYIVKDNSANVRPFYVDGMLVPVEAADVEEWRYFDGDSRGFTPNLVEFYWNGTPHGSTSTMKAHTRAGGRVIPLSRYGFTLVAMLGLGMPAPNNITVPLALPGGEQYQRTLSPASGFTLAGYVEAMGQTALRQQQRDLTALLDVRRQPLTQTLILTYDQLDDCGDVNGERAEVVCSFAGGLEGQWDNPVRENVGLKFQIHLPHVANWGGTEGAALAVRTELADADFILRRDTDGNWHELQTGLSATVGAIIEMPDGRWLVGGVFVNAGGVANADRLAYYDIATDTFTAVNATPLNATVAKLLLLPDGNVLVGGSFTNAGGDANADFLCLLTVATGAFSALNTTPLNLNVRTLELLPDGNVAVGGDFTNAGGDGNADFLCLLTLSTGLYSAFSTTVLNAAVAALEVDATNRLWVGGLFTNVGGNATQDFLTALIYPDYDTFSTLQSFTTLSGAVGVILALTNGSIAIGGAFTDVNGDTSWDYFATFVATNPALAIALSLNKVFSDISDDVQVINEISPGVIWVGGPFNSVTGLQLFDGLFQYSGNTLTPVGFNYDPAIADAYVVTVGKTGDILVGMNSAGPAYTSGNTTVTNSGTSDAFPVIVIAYDAAASGVAALYSIRNLTTNQVISFNLLVLPGETLTLDLTPGRKTFTSNLRGDLSGTILPGGNLSTFRLIFGDNQINIFIDLASGADATAFVYWVPALASLADVTR